jgi:hypothetical protein
MTANKDPPTREANCAHNEKIWARKERKQAWSAVHRAVKQLGEDTPTKSESLDEVGEEGEVTPPPQSLLHITPPPFSNITGQHVRFTVGEHRSKRHQTGTEPSVSLPQQH